MHTLRNTRMSSLGHRRILHARLLKVVEEPQPPSTTRIHSEQPSTSLAVGNWCQVDGGWWQVSSRCWLVVICHIQTNSQSYRRKFAACVFIQERCASHPLAT